MLNYGNLNDVEFEALCMDIMQKKLETALHRYAPGKDDGVDLRSDDSKIIIQVKHYINSTVSQLMSSLQKEKEKVERLNPKQYYVCCSKPLSPQKVDEIYSMFSKYMESPAHVVTIYDINSFLNSKENIDILERHYKLWIESTGILQSITNGDIFIDCETLLSTIEEEKALFVPTQAYYKGVDLLKHRKSLCIVGNPGVGKTITSKMLVLYFAAKGYRVRYTTNTSDLQSLKKSLSRSPKVPEIILIDDCFGQAYFNMKESQSSELLSIIKYVYMNGSKLLILNSRVTIYQEAWQKSNDLVRSFDNKEYHVHMIDMDKLPPDEKARIFYNHLTFYRLPDAYFAEIRKERRYLKIVKHTNYNPRLIEFVCRPRQYENIQPDRYYEFVLQNLENPKQMWRDEYVNRIQKPDRILLSTIYSFSDAGTSIEKVRDSFEHRIAAEAGVDRTVNQFQQSLNRLLKGFVVITDKSGKQMISMANPSVNDFLDGYYHENVSGKNELIEKSAYIEQFLRLLKGPDYEKWKTEAVKKHRIESIQFPSDSDRRAYIVDVISRETILDERYISDVRSFLSCHKSIYFYGARESKFKIYILDSLFKNVDVLDFYHVIDFLESDVSMRDLFHSLELDHLIRLILVINEYFTGEHRPVFLNASAEAIKDAMIVFCSWIDANDYDGIDVSSAIENARYDGPYIGIGVDTDAAASFVSEMVRDAVWESLYEKTNELPEDIVEALGDIDDVYIDVHGSEDLVAAFFEDGDYEYREPEKNTDDEEIDLIFRPRT